MYEAMRQRAPNSSKVTGASVAAVATVLVGWGLSSGLMQDIVPMLQPTTIMTPLEAPKEPPPPENRIEIEQTSLDTPFKPFPLPVFEVDAPPPSEGSGVVIGTGAGSGTGTGVKPAPALARVAPKMRPGDPPPYPAASIRDREEGDTGLKVCVSAKGRVTEASIASSSGFPLLDEAALKWVREARFNPGTLGGQAQDMCNHSVIYEWNLQTLCIDESERLKRNRLKPCPSKAR